MSIRVYWYDENSKDVVIREIIGNWTWEEFYNSQQTVNELMAQVDYQVDQVIDVSNSATLPQGALTQLKMATSYAPHNVGIRVVVGANRFYEVMASMLVRLMPNLKTKILMAQSHDEALQLIKEHRIEQQ